MREEHIISPGLYSSSQCEHNEYTDGGGPYFVSLSSLRPHCCIRTLPIVESTLRPASQVFGCDELWAVASRMGIWNPGEISYKSCFSKQKPVSDLALFFHITGEIAYFSEAIPLSYARTPEQLARAAPLRMQATAAGWAEALRQARSAINAFKARFPIEDVEDEYEYDMSAFEGSDNGSNTVMVSA